MTVADYLDLAADAPAHWSPDPFHDHPTGPWQERSFPIVVKEIETLLHRFDQGHVTERQLLHGKDNDRHVTASGRSYCHDVLSHWLYYHHHPGDERWKLLGQRYWSVDAWLAWKSKYLGTSQSMRLNGRDGRPHLRTFPKRKEDGPRGLVSEHVVPKVVMTDRMLQDRGNIAEWLRRNLCCVVTIDENALLAANSHPDATDPWRRYRGTGIVLLHNARWTHGETEAMWGHGLLSNRSVRPLN